MNRLIDLLVINSCTVERWQQLASVTLLRRCVAVAFRLQERQQGLIHLIILTNELSLMRRRTGITN